MLGGACWSFLGLGWPAAVVGAANGLISGARGTYRWTTPTGVLAFVLDSTWAAPMTAGALVAHVVAWLRPGRGGYVAAAQRASQPARLHRRLPACGRGFVITVGNTINNAGATVRVSPRRQRLITVHEDVHVWQGRWFGPLYPILYVSWTVVGGLAGALIWVVNRAARRVAVPRCRDVRVLPQPVRVVGVRPRRWLAATGQGRVDRRVLARGPAAQRPALTRCVNVRR